MRLLGFWLLCLEVHDAPASMLLFMPTYMAAVLQVNMSTLLLAQRYYTAAQSSLSRQLVPDCGAAATRK
jgi:hypothetical protein